MATGTLVTQRKKLTATSDQVSAWRYYGWPQGQGNEPKDNRCQSVGEVRYVIGWMADQLSRINWQVLINGSDEWSVTVGDQIIQSDPSVSPDAPGHSSVKEASRQLLAHVGWTPSTVRQTTTNLFVAGEFDYIATGDDNDPWRVVSVIHPDRDRILAEADFKVKGLWPHPAEPDAPDAPLFGVLPVLSDLDWLTRMSRAQSASRVGLRGILGAADGLNFANSDNFWDEFNRAMRRSMESPEDQSPLVLRGATDLIQNGLNWLIPSFPYNDKIDTQIDRVINRLAYGLPVPPEILLGMQAQSRATAFQVEGSAYRAHIEPPAELLVKVPLAALQFVLDKELDVQIVLDPSDLLARRYSVQDTTDALDRGAVGYSFYRETLGIPESAAATPEDIALLLAAKNGVSDVTMDPANSAASRTTDPETGEPTGTSVSASVGGTADAALPPDELGSLSGQLVSIDLAVREWLSGASGQAVERAREKIGASARSRDGLRSQIPKSVSNGCVAHFLGRQALDEAGVDYESVLLNALDPLARQWRDRMTSAQRQVTTLLGEEASPGFTEDDVRSSVNLLVELTGDHIMSTLTSPTAQPLGLFSIQRVLAASGGSPSALPGDVDRG